MFTQEIDTARHILFRLRGNEELRRRENAHKVMPTVHLVCCILRDAVDGIELESLWTGLSPRERRAMTDAYQELAVSASLLMEKTGNITPYEIVDHAGVRQLLISTISFAAEAADKMVGPLPPRVDAETLGCMISETLHALAVSAPLLRQIRPEDGPNHETVENLRNGLAHMSRVL